MEQNELQMKLWPEDILRGKAQRALINARKSQLNVASKIYEVWKGGDYQEWGYESIEQYCECEPYIKIKGSTAKKYIIAYEYAIKRNLIGEESTPDLGTLFQLARASRRKEISESEMKEIECAVIDLEEKDAKKEIKTHVKQRDHEISDDGLFDRILRNTNKLLSDMQTCHKVPDTTIDIMQNVIAELEAVK